MRPNYLSCLHQRVSARAPGKTWNGKNSILARFAQAGKKKAVIIFRTSPEDLFIKFCPRGKEAGWPSGLGVGLRVRGSRVRIPL